jgi:preprotein translocase subunit Sss1
MEQGKQTSLDTEIGNTETVTLQAKPVKVMKVEIRNVDIKGKQNEKLVCMCKHPDREELIEISQVKYEKKGMLVVSGLWISKDKDGKLIKNTATAILLASNGCRTMKEIEGKTLSTIQDERGYLSFKSY